MKVKVAECAALFWSGGQPVWDDALGHRQLALTPASEGLLRTFATWRELDDAGLGPEQRSIAARLIDAGVLLEWGSPAHENEVQVLTGWQPWGAAARQYHLASRTLATTVYLDDADSDAELEARAAYAPPPPPFKTYPEAPAVALATGPPASDDWEHGDLVDALHHRRSVREFAPSAVDLGRLTALLQLGGGIVERRADSLYGTVAFKASPSAGARDPIEIYAIVRNVVGVDPGLYHFSPGTNALEKVGELPSDDAQAAALGGQGWLAAAPVVLVYSAVIARTQWRYPSGRAYRDVLIGFGHVSQTVLVTAAAMGLGATVVTAVSDEDLETMFGLDRTGEPVLGVTAVGVPAPRR
ncbi:SagB/ThcOx family dehydrogenase [Pseudonocardia nigra]|uniref:SagB/ThcOx family dehydrogenase n=1 Tax=Pseudonocardia nigra TaxID=1921578 RepID=UPI001C5DE7B3|nr:SagB/ThcOx family dehydrogenase [Pseudonocardia nigra]